MSSTEFRTKIKHLRQKISKLPVVLDLIGGLAYLYAWLAGKTGKFDVSGIDEFEKLIADNDGGIFVAWHGRALMLPYFWRNPRQMKALVSPHNDGRIIARLLRGFNILSIDGSSYRKALPAALSIVHELEQGTVVALIPDGPRGPRMRLNKSVIYFAQKTGKPVIFVVCSGSTLALPWEAENLDAMLEAWYPGQQGGTAVADVLFGDYNPAGRLPLTFYASDSDLPDFEDYNMSNRTYRYFKGKPLFPFGYGLSYTTFDYGKAKVDKKSIKTGDSMTLTIPLKNTGKMDGDEVVQVYLRNPADKEGPIKMLRAFRRVSLKAGQAENIQIELPASTFECFNPATNRMEILPGNYELLYGGTSDGKSLQKVAVTLKK